MKMEETNALIFETENELQIFTLNNRIK